MIEMVRSLTSRAARERAGFEPCERRWRSLQAVRDLASQRRETQANLDEKALSAGDREFTPVEQSRAEFGRPPVATARLRRRVHRFSRSREVVRHKGQSAKKAGGGDERVRQAHGETTRPKLAHDLARAFGRSAIDGMSFQRAEERPRPFLLASAHALFDLGPG